jgi:hypothetical protein
MTMVSRNVQQQNSYIEKTSEITVLAGNTDGDCAVIYFGELFSIYNRISNKVKIKIIFRARNWGQDFSLSSMSLN